MDLNSEIIKSRQTGLINIRIYNAEVFVVSFIITFNKFNNKVKSKETCLFRPKFCLRRQCNLSLDNKNDYAYHSIIHHIFI